MVSSELRPRKYTPDAASTAHGLLPSHRSNRGSQNPVNDARTFIHARPRRLEANDMRKWDQDQASTIPGPPTGPLSTSLKSRKRRRWPTCV